MVEDVFLTDNADRSPTSFAVPAAQLLEAYRRADESGTEIVGIFHSHPASGARPSATDRRFMELNPVVWVVYSGADSAFGAYVLEGGRAEEIEITG